MYITAGIEQPTDLTAHMVAGIVAASLALHEYGRISRIDAVENVRFVQDLYNVTMDTDGVLKHYRSLWRSDSFYDDKLWAVCTFSPFLVPRKFLLAFPGECNIFVRPVPVKCAVLVS